MNHSESLPSSTSTDVLIIGAGPAGLYAAFSLGLQGLECHIIDALPHIGGQCIELFGDKLIYDIPAIKACTGKELIAQLMQQASIFKPTLHLQRVVNAISPQSNNRFKTTLDDGTSLDASCLLIATGAGAFLPRQIKIEGLDEYEAIHVEKNMQQQLFFHAPTSSQTEQFSGKHILISGDLEGSLQTANQLALMIENAAKNAPAKVTLVHRRDKFRAEESTIALTAQLRQNGHLHFIAGQLTALHHNNGNLTQIDVKESATQETLTLPTDALFVLHGLAPKVTDFSQSQLGHLSVEGKLLPINIATFQTSTEGIYAIGDAITYAGKRKLIASCFHEAALASYAIASYLQGGAPIPQIYTTSNSKLREVLQQEENL